MTQVKNGGDLTCWGGEKERPPPNPAAAEKRMGARRVGGPPLHRYHRSQEFKYSVLLSDAVLLPAYLV